MTHLINEESNNLAERLKSATVETTLYCDYYYFALIIGDDVEFWLNRDQFLARLNKSEVPDFVTEYLETNCPKFYNFYKNGQYNQKSTVEWKQNLYYPQNIPEIGNAYSAMIYKIVTEKDNETNKRVIHLHEDWGKGGWAEFETIGEKEVHAFLTLTIFSETYKKVKSIHDLDCFKPTIANNIYK